MKNDFWWIFAGVVCVVSIFVLVVIEVVRLVWR